MTMKIAVISDIHGNYEALKKVMEDMGQFEIDEIYCLGDVVSLGHQTNEVLAVLSEMENLTLITGNHDDEVMKALKDMKSEVSGPEHNHHLWVSRHIDPKYIHMLEGLPLTIEKRVAGHKILLTHYHLDGCRYRSIERFPSLGFLEEIYGQEAYSVVLYGHDHITQHFKTSGPVMVNPGALGVTDTAFAPYVILELKDDGAMKTIFRSVPYDRRQFIEGLKRENPPALDFIMEFLLKE